jgi:hypothetical protein
MKNLRLITPSAACALGAALLVTTALQSMPAEALSRGVKAGSQKVASGQISARSKQPTGTIAKPTRAPIPAATGLNPVKLPGGGNQGAVAAAKPTLPSIPPLSGQTITGTVSFPGSVKQPPATGSINPGSYPGGVIGTTPTHGNRPTIIVAGPIKPGTYPGGVSTYPGGVSTTPTHGSIPPGTGQTNPGNYPHTPPIYPGTPPIYPGGGTVPTPTPIPVPIPTGSSPSPNPGYGSGTSYTHQHGQVRAYAGVGAVGYAPCWWLKSNYDKTGSAYWLKRYRVCLSQY